MANKVANKVGKKVTLDGYERLATVVEDHGAQLRVKFDDLPDSATYTYDTKYCTIVEEASHG